MAILSCLHFYILSFSQCVENTVELRLDTCIHAIRVVFENETADDLGVHLSLELHSSISLTLHHLAHLLLCGRADAGSGDETPTDDVLLLAVKRDVRIGDELHHRLTFFLQHEADEGTGQSGRLAADKISLGIRS